LIQVRRRAASARSVRLARRLARFRGEKYPPVTTIAITPKAMNRPTSTGAF
jgi:hypothetical protein